MFYLNMKLSAEHMRVTKYGKLLMEFPNDTMGGSHKRVSWVCDCKKTTSALVYSVTSGSIKSCGKCNALSAEHMRVTKYGKLLMEFPTEIKPGSHQKISWIC